MATRKTLLDLLDELAPQVQQAFLNSIARITSDVQLSALEDAIRRGDVEGALRILQVGPEYLAPLDRALRDAYAQGGDYTMEAIRQIARQQGAQVSIFFNERNPRAEAYTASRSSRLVVEIIEDQRDGLRRVLTNALERGTAPRSAALDIIGRIDRAAGRRTGGIVGLTSQQMDWADTAYAELVSGDPASMRNYLTRKARDLRFDRTVIRAISEGRAIKPTDASNMVARYRDRLLNDRGNTIARTELLGSLHHAQNEGLQQLVDSGAVRADQVTRRWDSAEDSATRESHRAMDDQRVGINEPFVSPVTGARLMFPGDTSLGAPGSEIINCRCVSRPSIDFIAGLGPGD